jgi:hypothetical protein
MDATYTTHPATAEQERPPDVRRAVGIGLTASAFLLAGALVAFAAVKPAPDGASGLSAQQIVIRGEVADRALPLAGALSSEQIVIRGEVADRTDD